MSNINFNVDLGKRTTTKKGKNNATITNKAANVLATEISTNWDANKLEKFMGLLVVGYFGVKILYGMFGKYSPKPAKYEMIDFVSMVVLGGLIYLFTNMENRNVLGHMNNTNWFLFLGFLLGLSGPLLRDQLVSSTIYQQSSFLQYFTAGVFLFIVIVMLYLSARSAFDASSQGSGSLTNYMLYLLVVALLILGLIFTRKQSSVVSTTTVTQPEMLPIQPSPENPENMDDIIPPQKITNGFLKTPGQYISLGLGMMGWLMCLIFVYDAEESVLNRFLSILNGFFLGLFVAGMSYDGIGYILDDGSSMNCPSQEECSKSGFFIKGEQYQNVQTSISTLQWILATTVVLLVLMVILFYFMRD